MFDVSRRFFLAGAAASGARCLLGGARSCAAAETAAPHMGSRHLGGGEAHLRLGVLSDIHIYDEKNVPVFERALAFFRDRKAVRRLSRPSTSPLLPERFFVGFAFRG